MRLKVASGVMVTLLTISILSIFPILVPQVKAQTGWWTTKASLPHPQAVFGAAVVNSKIYAIGGQYRDQDQYVWLDTNYEYNPMSDNWIPRASMPTKRSTLAAVSANDKIYAIGGAASVSGGALSTNEEFDPVSNSWTGKASMPTPRNWISAAVVNGKVYVIGGSDNSGSIFSMNEMYDPLTDTWTTKAQCPHARLACGIGVVNGKIYLIGGWVPGEPTTLNEEYDPQADTWTTKAPMPSARNGLGVAVVNNRIYATGGATNFNPWTNNLNVVEEYDPSTDTWRTVQSMPTSRSLLSTAATGNKIYAIGGVLDSHSNTGYLDTNEEFNAYACMHDWPMFRHDLSHTGSSTSTAPETNNTVWSFLTGGIVLSSPAVVDGVVYVGSNDCNVYALNAMTGSKIWNYTTGGGVQLSSPAVVYGMVYVGSLDDKVYCLNASTGSYIWSYTTGGEVWSSPSVAYGKVYVGSLDFKVYCLDAATGAHIWNYTTGGDVISSPAISDDKVYVGSGDNKVYCLSASTGTHIWNYTTGGPRMESSPTVADGGVYIGSDDHNVYRLNALTGALIWNYTIDHAVESSPAVAYGMIYVGAENGKVYCLNASNGAHVWDYTTGEEIDSCPAVADDKVYIGSADDKVYCLNASTGSYIWSYTTGGDVDSSPAIAYNRVYVGSLDYRLYAFGSQTCIEIPIKGGENATITANVTITNALVTKNTLHFDASGPSGSTGWINVTFPMVNTTEIKVFINNVKLTPPPFPIVTTNGTHYIIYFEVALSTHEITIQYAVVDIAVTDIGSFRTIVGQGYDVSINVTIRNQGDFPEDSNITLYADKNTTVIGDEITIENQTVYSLVNGTATTLTLDWNTTGVPYGNYTITANATILQGETDTADNTYTDGWVVVTIPGDVDGSFKVNYEDLFALADAYGSHGPDFNYPGEPESSHWDLYSDFNGDNQVNYEDLFILADHYGMFI